MMGRDAASVGAAGRRELVVLVLVLAAAALLAPPAAGADLRLRVVETESEATTAYVDPETGLYVLAPPTGHVEAEYGQRSLSARRAEYDPEAGTLLLAGAVRLREPGLTAEAEKMTADLRAEEYRLEGQVWVERSRDGGASSILTAAQLVYRPSEGEAQASGDVRVEEDSRWFQASSARLWDDLGRLDLSGEVAGDWLEWAVERAERVQVVLDGGEVTLFGPAEIRFQVAEPPAGNPANPAG